MLTALVWLLVVGTTIVVLWAAALYLARRGSRWSPRSLRQRHYEPPPQPGTGRDREKGREGSGSSTSSRKHVA